VGPPNVGKSSLLNSLLGTNRAIVTPLAGTTRDVVEGEMLLKGVRVRLFDTAGIREAGNVVEEEGIRRSKQVIEEADILFWLVDASHPEESLGELKKNSLPLERTWFLFNKMDLVKNNQKSFKEFLTALSGSSASPSRASEPAVSLSNPSKGLGKGLSEGRCLGLSCETGAGLERVFERIESLLEIPLTGEDAILTSARHQGEVQIAKEALQKLEGLMKSKEPMELWAEELKEAILAIGRIRGRNLSQAAFEEIFSKFCIGK
jgi:tRNA modification GTPase